MTRLKRFLLKENIYGKFAANYGFGVEDYVKRKNDDGSSICGAFLWVSTKEGHEFWDNVSKKFGKFVNHTNSKEHG